MDGSIVRRNLKELNLNQAWLEEQLNQAGSSLTELQTIVYAELQADGTLYVDKRKDMVH
ncbi:YetF domain-containing protein [Paenibacillus cremeus]|uniref:YetF domain-containing protein n=1 Tax=Paenibacillus cremeus TaxID=2163881 RepID=UPI0016481349|nr:YetF domain-containing protein [Paenibacillus cremeus]